VYFGDAGGSGGLQFVGRQDNIDAAEATLLFLSRQVEAVYKARLPKGVDKRDRAEYRRTFKDACANRISTRANQLMRDMVLNNDLAKAATGSTALVVQGYFEQCFKEAEDMMKEEFPDIKSTERKYKYGLGSLDGREAGDQVKLRQEVK
jgi:hypothetical protein